MCDMQHATPICYYDYDVSCTMLDAPVSKHIALVANADPPPPPFIFWGFLLLLSNGLHVLQKYHHSSDTTIDQRV